MSLTEGKTESELHGLMEMLRMLLLHCPTARWVRTDLLWGRPDGSVAQHVLASPKWCLTSTRVGRTYAGRWLHQREQRWGQACWKCKGTALWQPVHGITLSAASQGKSGKRSAARKNQQQKGIILLLPPKTGWEGMPDTGRRDPILSWFREGDAVLVPLSCKQWLLVWALPP